MGDVVTATFGKTLGPIKGMPKSAPEVLNQLAVLSQDRGSAIKHLAQSERLLVIHQREVEGWRDVVANIDAKIHEAQQGLVDDIIREVLPGRTR